MKKTIIGLLYSGKLEKDLFIKYQNSCNKISENILLLPVTKEVLERRTFALPKSIYNLCYNSNDKIVKDIERIIGKNKVFNRITKFSKWEIYKLLKPYVEIYLPERHILPMIL
ncbi:hypothetical protein SAMN02745227_02102 [Anaerobranca californiensis DSM 14826]|jgi:hypothetical protein|uniref:Uncharacterized protein n=1 Tax=Anaerobranca californiensis DSM 14826 TaxID=1120989 RepID=A0A1M6RTJ8_9FIRM|nr:hypothetical protein [Anaerobranca californiensis]SHK35765.1 hypothetical protein SAMN02745227_02102 [Anaerobranca californiensis DSM 14826]